MVLNTLSIVYLNYNGKSILRTTLPLLISCALKHEIIIVDNGSSDDSTEIIDEITSNAPESRIKKIYLPENKGFSGGNNAGLDASESDITAFVSNDVVFPRYFRWDSVIDACQENVLFGQHKVDWDGGWNNINGDVYPYVSGYFVAANKKVWGIIRWDESFYPCDCEDVDLSIQAFHNSINLHTQDLGAQHLGGRTITNPDRILTTYRLKKVLDQKWGSYGR